jgi:hypothetical protein
MWHVSIQSHNRDVAMQASVKREMRYFKRAEVASRSRRLVPYGRPSWSVIIDRIRLNFMTSAFQEYIVFSSLLYVAAAQLKEYISKYVPT